MQQEAMCRSTIRWYPTMLTSSTARATTRFQLNGLVLGQRSPVIVVTGKVSLLPAVTEVSGGVNRGVPDGSSLLIFQKQDFGF